MSLLGETVDSFLVSLDTIVSVVLNALSLISNFIISLFGIITTILQLIYYMFGFFEFIISIILNPYLILLFLLGTSFYYSAFTSSNRKDMLIKMAIFWKYIGENSIKIAHAIYTLVTRIIVGIINIV